MSDWETVKRPRHSLNLNQETTTTINQSQLPFSAILSNSFRHSSEKHPVLSDKKLTIYDLKVERPDLPLNYEENAWDRLKFAIHAIQKSQSSPESLEVLYQLCENLCQYDKAQRLYELLYEECRNYTQLQFEILASNIEEGINYLRTVQTLWNSYCDQISQIRCLFLYLDRTYIASNTKIGSFWNMSMTLFRENFMHYDTVWKKVLHSILQLIQLERSGQEVDQAFLQSSIKMLMDLNLYHSAFEKELLQETRLFYNQEGNTLIGSIDIFKYLEHISTRVHQESVTRVKNYFDKSTKSQLQSIVETELLTKRVEDLLNKCFDYFHGIDQFDEEDYDRFSLLYRLLLKVNKLDICAKYFTLYVKTKGSFILCQPNKNIIDKMKQLSSFESQMDEVVDHSFEGDEQFVDGLKDGTEHFINLRSNNAIKLLAKYIDQVLTSNSSSTEELLEKGMYIFRNLQAKDEFELLYKRDLAKRLLLDITSSRNAERIMLNKMKKECGAGYTGKMEGMVKDIEKSNDLMDEFKVINHGTNNLPINMNVNLLTNGFWPSYAPIAVNLPPIFHQLQNIYTNFYMQKYEKRILTWQNSLGVCTINAHYPLGSKQITLTLLQTIVLLLFNDSTSPSLSFTDILAWTKLDELELRRTLVSLSCREYKLLKKYPEGDDIEATDQFSFNQNFTSDRHHLKMTTATLSEVIEKNATMNTTVLFAREEQVDAVIVRIMKSKSTLTHGLLLSEVTRIVKFPVTAQDVKKRIEKLIEKDFLERGPDDSYIYVA